MDGIAGLDLPLAVTLRLYHHNGSEEKRGE